MKVSNSNEFLPCKLTNEELLDYGDQMARVQQDINAEEDRQKSAKEELKSRMAKLESQRSELANKVARKEEYRDVEVETTINYEAETYSKIRLDTGEVLFQREITEEERQMELTKEQP